MGGPGGRGEGEGSAEECDDDGHAQCGAHLALVERALESSGRVLDGHERQAPVHRERPDRDGVGVGLGGGGAQQHPERTAPRAAVLAAVVVVVVDVVGGNQSVGRRLRLRLNTRTAAADTLQRQEAFEKCLAHSRLRAASRPLTRCRYR